MIDEVKSWVIHPKRTTKQASIFSKSDILNIKTLPISYLLEDMIGLLDTKSGKTAKKTQLQ